jgi:four helix bundle protein
MLENKHEIHDRIYKFVLLVLQLIKFIPKTTENLVLIKQIVRSSSSIGANASEADGSESKKEFIHRFTISNKEAKETFYWLSLISDHNKVLKEKFKAVLEENRQIILIISKIIINAKKKNI